jgi:hypothetical protein
MEYNFYKDEEMSVWNRTYFTVEASSYEEALSMITEDPYELDKKDIFVKDSELLFDTMESLPPIDHPTLEIFHYNDNIDELVYQNG